MTSSQDGSKRKTIGLLVDNLFDAHEEGIRRTIMQEAEAADANLICFLGGRAWGQYHGRALYELAGRENVDGIISVSTCLQLADNSKEGEQAPGVSQDGALEALLRGYAPVPVVSMGKPVRGIASLLVENGAGLRELMEHMVTVHGLQRIAFLRGPAGNEEAEARFLAYRSVLEKHGLPYDETRIFQGDFQPESGARAVKVLVDERHAEFDALVAANDYMAIFASDALQRRGVAIPGKIAIGGFDDIRPAVAHKPPLTTVRQPTREMARLAVEYLLSMIQGQTVPLTRSLPTSLVIRGSCGCVADSGDVKDVGVLASSSEVGPAAGQMLGRRLQLLYPWVGEILRIPTWAEELVESFYRELEKGSGTRFLAALEKQVAHGLELGIMGSEWQMLVKTMYEGLRRQIASHLRERVGALRDRSLLLVANVTERFQIALNVKQGAEIQNLQRMFRPGGKADRDDLWFRLEEHLPLLGISSFFLLREDRASPGQISLEHHFSHDDSVVLDAPLGPCSIGRLLPGRFTPAHRTTFIVLPVSAGPEATRFAICSLGSVSGAVFESIAYQLGHAVDANR
jgi:DNA-binding LacI/PurR family transcriptional regulator